MRLLWLSLIYILFYTLPAKAQSVREDTIKLLEVYTIPFHASSGNTLIGGLSGIDMAPDGHFYLISDDRSEFSPARFYKVKIEYGHQGIDTIIWEEVHYLKQPNGQQFEKGMVDPESIRLSPDTNTLYYSSEGDRKRNIDPFLWEMNMDGSFLRELVLPYNFKFGDNTGLVHNGALESISLSTNREYIWIINEEPLLEDGPRADIYPTKSPLRMSLIHRKSGKLLHQFAYELGPIPTAPIKEFDFKVNSTPEILAITENEFLILERAYVQDVGNFVNLFFCEINKATDVKGINSLVDAEYTPLSKELFIDFSKYPVKPDNIEGIAWGKPLANGNRTLIFVSDNNFNNTQTTQFWLFEVLKKK